MTGTDLQQGAMPALVPEPQDPTDPETPRSRLTRMIAARADVLQKSPQLTETPPVPGETPQQWATRDIVGRIRDPLARDDFVTFIKTGARTHGVAAWMGQAGTDDPTNPEFYRNQQQNTVLRGLIEVPTRLVAGVSQGFANTLYGAANLLGADVKTPDMETSWIAIAKTIGSGRSYDQVYAEEQAKMQAYEQNRGLLASVTQGAATTVGQVISLGKNPVLAAGSSVGQWVVGAAGRIAENPLLLSNAAKLAAAGAGGFGALKFVDQQPGEDKVAFQQRLENGVVGVVTGPLYELTGAMGKGAFYRILQGGGRDAEGLSKVVGQWAAGKGMQIAQGEARGPFFVKVLNGWIDEGMPGLQGLGINARKAAALGAQALIEAAGFSAIDTNFRKDLTAAWLGQDKEAWSRLAVDFTGSALGMFALRAGGRLGNIPQIQRDAPDPAEGRQEQFRPEPPPAGEPTPPPAPKPPNPVEDMFLANHLWRYGWAPVEAQRAEPAPPEEPPKTGMLALAQPQRFELPDFPTDATAAKERALQALYRAQPGRSFRPSTESLAREPSTYWFEVNGEDATPSPALREALGLPETMPADEFMPLLEKASLVSALHSKAALPGQEVSVEGVHGEGDTLRTIRYGVVHEREASPSSVWLKADNAPMRGRDVLAEKQQIAVDELKDAAKRQDLEPTDQILLGATVGTLGKVAAERDKSVAEALPMLPELTKTIRDGSPEDAAAAIKQAAELLTSKSPKAIKAEQAFLAKQKESKPTSNEATKLDTSTAASEPSPAPAKAPAGSETPTGEGAAGAGSKAVEPKLPEPPAKPEPPPDEVTQVSAAMIPPVVADVLKDTAQGTYGLGKKALDYYNQPLIPRAEAAGAPPDVIDKLNAANTASKGFRARIEKEAGLSKFQKMVQAKKSGALKPEVRSLEHVITDEFGGGTTDLVAALDEKTGNHFGRRALNEKEQAIVDAAHRLIVEPAKIAADNKIGFTNAPGGLTGDEGLYRFPRKMLPDGRAALDAAASPQRAALEDWLAKAKGWDASKIEASLGGMDQVIRHDNTEYKRAIDVLPSRLTGPNGEEFRIYDDTTDAIPKITNNAAQVLGARSVFKGDEPVKGGDESVPPGAQKVLQDVLKSSGRRAMEATRDAIKALHGIPLDPKRAALGLEDGTPESNLARNLVSTLNLTKSGKLSLAFVNHAFTWAQDFMHYGPALLRGWGSLAKDAMTGRLPEEMQRLAGEGYMTLRVPNRRVAGDTKTETYANVTQRIGGMLTKPLDIIISMLKVAGAKATEERSQAMERGDGSAFDRSLLTALDFRPEQIDRMVNGQGTPEEYARYRTGAVNRLEGGVGETPVERPLSAHSPLFDNAVWFQNIFRHRTKVLRSYGDELAAAKGLEAKGQVVAKLAGFIALNSLAGFGVQLVRKWLKGESFGDWLRETQSDPFNAVRTLVMSSIAGVAGETVWQIGAQAMEGATRGQMLETIGRMIGPTSVAVDTAMFLSSLVGRDVPGYEDMTSLQKVGKFIRQGVPAAAAVHRGLFGIAATAISDRPPELQNARDAMYRWEQMNGPASTPDPRQPDQIQWLDAMREVTKSVEKGGNWGDNELMDAMEKASIFGKDKNSIAESLRAKEVFKGPLDPRSRKSFDQAKYDSLVSYLGPQHTATLEAFDATLEYLAKRWVARHSGK